LRSIEGTQLRDNLLSKQGKGDKNEDSLTHAKGSKMKTIMGYKGVGGLGKFEQGPLPKIGMWPKGLGLGASSIMYLGRIMNEILGTQGGT